MHFRAGIRLIAMASAVIWLAPVLVLAGAQEEGDEQPAAGAAAADSAGAELPEDAATAVDLRLACRAASPPPGARCRP